MIVAIGEVTISLLGVIVILQSRGGSKLLLLLDELDVLFCNDDDGVDDDAIDVDVADAAMVDDNEGIWDGGDCCIDSCSSSSSSRSSLEFRKGEWCSPLL